MSKVGLLMRKLVSCWGFDEEIGLSKQRFRKFSKGFSDTIVGTHS